jgi:DNA mismatch repair protein MutL
MEVDPAVVDVNIHPTKQEVRFEQPRAAHQILAMAIQQSLGRTSGSVPASWAEQVRPQYGQEEIAAERISEPQAALFREERPVPEEIPVQKSFLHGEGLRVLGQLGETYILCESSDGLVLIDQHAAHERVLYETLRSSSRDGHVETQAFLIPQRMEFSLKDARVLEKGLEPLRRLGLEMEPFGGSAFVLRTVPSVLLNRPLEKMLVEMLPALEGGDLRREGALDGLLTVMACHGAIRANQGLTHPEMSVLVQQLLAAELPTNCPHGRPTMKRLGYDELARMFKRVV